MNKTRAAWARGFKSLAKTRPLELRMTRGDAGSVIDRAIENLIALHYLKWIAPRDESPRCAVYKTHSSFNFGSLPSSLPIDVARLEMSATVCLIDTFAFAFNATGLKSLVMAAS